MHSLTQPELKALLAAVSQPAEAHPVLSQDRARLLIKVAYWHGLRATEAISLQSKDIQNGYLNVQRLKGSLRTAQKYVVHGDPALDESAELAELANTLKPNDRLFPISRFGFYQLMRRAGKRAGLPPHKCHPHVLKHTCAMTIIPKGVHHTRKYLGHRSLASTGEYLNVTDDQASDAMAEVAKLGG